MKDGQNCTMVGFNNTKECESQEMLIDFHGGWHGVVKYRNIIPMTISWTVKTHVAVTQLLGVNGRCLKRPTYLRARYFDNHTMKKDFNLIDHG